MNSAIASSNVLIDEFRLDKSCRTRLRITWEDKEKLLTVLRVDNSYSCDVVPITRVETLVMDDYQNAFIKAACVLQQWQHGVLFSELLPSIRESVAAEFVEDYATCK